MDSFELHKFLNSHSNDENSSERPVVAGGARVGDANAAAAADGAANVGKLTRRRSTFDRLKIVELNARLDQQYREDKRFHPSVIGGIMVIFLVSVAFFISQMEGISYFDSFYASFITYSTIGFGDINIFVGSLNGDALDGAETAVNFASRGFRTARTGLTC